jgi:putative flippase GtrA
VYATVGICGAVMDVLCYFMVWDYVEPRRAMFISISKECKYYYGLVLVN